jgi:hypothetical protein
MNFLLNLGGHPVKLRENKAIDNSASRPPSRAKLDVVPLSARQHMPPCITVLLTLCDPTPWAKATIATRLQMLPGLPWRKP